MRPRILHFPQHCQTVHYWHSQRFLQPPITSLDTIPQKIIHYQSWYYLLKQALPIFSKFNVTIHNQLWVDINSPNHPLPVLSWHGSLQPSITSLELTYIPTTIQYQSWHHFLKPSTTTNLDIISYNHSLPFWHHFLQTATRSLSTISYKHPLPILASFPTTIHHQSWHDINTPGHPLPVLRSFLQPSITGLDLISCHHPLQVLTSFPTTIHYKP